MKKVLMCIGAMVLCAGPIALTAYAEGEIKSDVQAIKAEAQEIKEDASAAKQEEAELRVRIRAATEAGDMETVKILEDELKAMHKGNIEEKQQDKQDLAEAKQELKEDIKEARSEGVVPPKIDKDNNPPGPRGGAGTNWENPPGPKGGPGTGPDRHPRGR